MANARVHGETGRVPAEALLEERPALLPLPAAYRGQVAPARARAALKLPEPMLAIVPPQHALALYDRLLEVAA